MLSLETLLESSILGVPNCRRVVDAQFRLGQTTLPYRKRIFFVKAPQSNQDGRAGKGRTSDADPQVS